MDNILKRIRILALVIFVFLTSINVNTISAAPVSKSTVQAGSGSSGGMIKPDPNNSWPNPVPFDPNNPNKYVGSTPPNGSGTPSEDDPSSPWYVPGWVDDLIQKINDMIQMFKDLMSGKLIRDAIKGLIVLWVDEFMSPLYGAFQKSYLFTPQVAEIPLVYKGWSLFSIVGLVALLAGTAFLAIKVVRGKQDMKKLLYTFIGCFFGLLLSLTVLNFANVGINFFGQKAIEGTLGTTNISYKDLTGQEILKALVIGRDAITDPTYQAKTLGQITVETEGGIFTLLGMLLFIVFPLFLVSVIKALVLIILVIFVGIWISRAAFTGKTESLAGFFNLYIRTLIVGLVTAIHWAIFVRMQSDYGTGIGFASDIGISPIIFSGLSVLALLVFFFFFWIKPLFKAVISPVTLGGGEVVEKMGRRGVKASETLNAMGKRFGAETLQRKSLNFKSTSQKMIAAGQKMQNSRGAGVSRAASKMTKGASEDLQGIKYIEPLEHEWLVESGTIVVKDNLLTEVSEPTIHSDSAVIHEKMKENGFKDSTLLKVSKSDQVKMKNVYTKLKADYKDNISWNAASGELLVYGDHKQALNHLQESGIKFQNRAGLGKDGVFVDPVNKKVQQVENTKKAESTKKEVQSVLPTSTHLKLKNADPEAAHQSLLNKGYSWASKLKPDNNGIWVPDDLIQTVKPSIESLLSSKSEIARIDLPKNSRFLKGMIEHWKHDGIHDDLVKSLEPNFDKAYVMVHKDHVNNFKRAYEEYRKNRKPYWRTKDGKIKVIIDNVPVDYGQAPLMGLDMGSFEEMQKESISRHHSRKKQ